MKKKSKANKTDNKLIQSAKKNLEEKTKNSEFDDLFGVWSEKDAENFFKSISDMETIE